MQADNSSSSRPAYKREYLFMYKKNALVKLYNKANLNHNTDVIIYSSITCIIFASFST